MKAHLLVLLIRLLALFPLGIVRGLGALLGRLTWLANTRMKRTALINLQLCFPALDNDARQALARQSLIETFRTFCEAGATWCWPTQDIIPLIEIAGLDCLRAAHAAGKGVIVVSPHLGNWELTGLYLNTCGLGQTSQMYQAPAARVVDALLFNSRSRSGARMVPTDNRGVAELLQGLRRGEIVGILPDQVPPANGGEFAPFFGVPALTMTLLNRLQQKTGARIVLGATIRLPGTNPAFRLHFREANAAAHSADLPTALAGLNHGMEQIIAEVPEQYQWSYKRFKRQPEGYPRVY